MSDLTLDELFATATAEYKKTLTGKGAKPAPSIAPTPATQWQRGFNIRLMHRETNTVLGDFSEWRQADGSRKLVREPDNSLPIHKIEWMSGYWGARTPIPQVYTSADERYQMEIPVTFEAEEEFIGTAKLTVTLTGGAVTSATLLAEASFAAPSEILVLPQLFNLYPLLTRAAKIALFEEVRRQRKEP